ncbi:TetR/AcrR family transcriptional regulator [Nonomuraea guangzhouensis]|uniref:TetR/AcrR family transcriptional regulator n=1 Tax=Nonomuraea guangzhouensis TaxID=1291555 RepID=A0ABW4G442_9ACTN|nr:TetR/AcrR family transcriptional regulator [Nonomuraea guangzhouensis]
MPRDTLTREQIVRAAIEILDTEGVDGLSMRRLGTRLGSAATAVYWHVKSKDNLVVLAGDEVWAEVELPDPGEVGWRTAATAMANDTRAMIARHPWLVTAMSTHLMYGPGKARRDDHCLAVFEAAGFVGVDADNASKTVLTYVLGTALSEVAEAAWRARLRRNGGNEEEQMRDAMTQASEIAMRFPRLRARLEAWEEADAAAPPDQSFELGLQAILDGLKAQLTTRATPI